MSHADRFVFDTSTVFGAVLRADSAPHLAIVVASRRGTLCISPATLAELEEVVLRTKLDAYSPRALRLRFLEGYRRLAALFEVPETAESDLDPPCRDPKDNKFLALALSCQATLIVSSDRDLLSLKPLAGDSHPDRRPISGALLSMSSTQEEVAFAGTAQHLEVPRLPPE